MEHLVLFDNLILVLHFSHFTQVDHHTFTTHEEKLVFSKRDHFGVLLLQRIPYLMRLLRPVILYPVLKPVGLAEDLVAEAALGYPNQTHPCAELCVDKARHFDKICQFSLLFLVNDS